MSDEEYELIDKYQEKIQDEKYQIYCLEQELAKLQQRIDKAIKYIDYKVGRIDDEIWKLELDSDEYYKLLSI